MARTAPKKKYESEPEFMDRVLWGLAARLALEAAGSWQRTYLYYRPSTPDDWGVVGVAEADPGAGGFQLVTPEPIPIMSRGVEGAKSWIHSLLRKLPILPTSQEAFERGIA
jgi:hypothetical protein